METIGEDLRSMQRIPLAASHVAALRAAGEIATYSTGSFIVRPGDPADRFFYVEDGEVELVNPFSDERLVAATLGPTQFMGEISFLNGGAWSMPMRTVRDTRLIGEDEDRNVRRIAAFAGRNRIPYTSLPLGSLVDTRALFIMVGAAPNTKWLSGLLDLDHQGFVLTGSHEPAISAFSTSRRGVFAVGDVRAGSVKRLASAVGEGSVVISQVWQFINRNAEG